MIIPSEYDIDRTDNCPISWATYMFRNSVAFHNAIIQANLQQTCFLRNSQRNFGFKWYPRHFRGRERNLVEVRDCGVRRPNCREPSGSGLVRSLVISIWSCFLSAFKIVDWCFIFTIRIDSKDCSIHITPKYYNFLPDSCAKLWAIIRHNNHSSNHILISQQSRGEPALRNT